ncbi:PfkB family carbohydrate kinase [Niabella soli]|uniref:Ribokinase n=1 Tax=Niabella soli DSM 19437 TaxID=929713 RepID=W0ETZ9_9BACT|nr:PfkB family carbohydrate kinase [Niabella soli]AHF14285.1 ribokinase [Niabella soli DSM 19437]
MKNKVICFGEVLWDDFGTTKTIGGAPLNVGYHLSKLAIEPVIVSQVGKDEPGRGLLQQLDQWQLVADYCVVSDVHPTSTVNVQLLENGEVTYTITENVAWDFVEYDNELAGKIKEADAFIYGTLAARTPYTRATLLRYLEHAKWRVLDLNLRPPYTDRETLLLLIRSCHSLKLNRGELDFIGSFLGKGIETEAEGAALIFAAFDNIEEIILTKGEKGAAYYNRKEQWSIEGLTVPVMDTVGSGDAFLAAFVGGKLKGRTHRRQMEDAVVLSAFIATRQGACPSYTPATVQKFKEKYYEANV